MPRPDPSAKEDSGPKVLPSVQGLLCLSRQMEEILANPVASGGLARAECFLLLQLATPRRMGELARCLHLVPSAVTSAADRLEAQGLIQRVKDPSDRRAFLLRLTRRGNRHRARIEQSCSAALRTICGLSGQEFDLLLQLSGKIKETAQSQMQQMPGKEI